MKASENLILYSEKRIIAEVFKGDNYYLPTDGTIVNVFKGNLEAFLIENPKYREETL